MSDRGRPHIRAFLAIPLPESLKQAIGKLQRTLVGEAPEVRWVKPESLHLTLRFFGETTQEDLEKIKVSMLSVKRIQQPFAVEVKSLGAFPSPRRPRVLWLGLPPRMPLQELYESCQGELEKHGLSPEQRPFAPHLTIGRIRQQGSDLSALTDSYATYGCGELPISRIVLFESRLQRHGAKHIPLQTIELSGADFPE